MKDRRLQFVLAGTRSCVRACVRSCMRACVGASDCLSASLFAPRSLAAKMKIARLARGYKRQLYVPNVGLWPGAKGRTSRVRACVRVASNTSLNSTTDLRTDLRTAACHTTRHI